MEADKGMKPKISKKTVEENAEQIDSELALSIKKLQEVQDELEKINEEASDKILEVEQKYNEVRKPLYDNRSEIIKSIPDFWLTALSHPVFSNLLPEEDKKIFKHLTSLEVEDCKDVKLGYSVSFNFSPNPFFENTKLTKTITFSDEGTTKVTSTSIKWKEGMGLPNGDAHEKKRYKRDESFFSWLSGAQQKFESEVAELIRGDFWTNPLTYFNNDADDEKLEGNEEVSKMVDDKGKKPKISEKTVEENAEQSDSELALSIKKLQEVQDELEEINEEATDKILEVELKYNEVRKPLHDKRSEIIKSIPDFWPTAFLSHPVLSGLLNAQDEEIFKHLTSLEVEDCKDVKLGYSVSFNFSPNPFFENTKLTKTFIFSDEGTTKVTATSIKWKEGMGLPNGDAHEKKGYKRDTSFLSWLGKVHQKDESEVIDLIREDLWANPLNYFNDDCGEEELEGMQVTKRILKMARMRVKMKCKVLKFSG